MLRVWLSSWSCVDVIFLVCSVPSRAVSSKLSGATEMLSVAIKALQATVRPRGTVAVGAALTHLQILSFFGMHIRLSSCSFYPQYFELWKRACAGAMTILGCLVPSARHARTRSLANKRGITCQETFLSSAKIATQNTVDSLRGCI